jgi:hypothetical protein
MTPEENGWHLAQAQLADYAGGRSTFAQAASVEKHLTACAGCRSMLTDVLPALPVDRMWRHILAATDPAPKGRRHRAAGRMRMWSWTALFPASAIGPRRIGIAVLTFLLGLTMVVPLAYSRDREETVGTVTATAGSPQQPTVEFPPLPETFKKRVGTPGSPDASAPVPLQAAPPQAAHREPRDRIPWRSGRHPD